MLERVSPQVIVLDPPEKLVIETRASGGYRQIEWIKNGNPFTLGPGQPFTITLQEFPNFFEIFVRDSTTLNDLGLYEVELVLNTGPQPPEIDFTVTPYSKYRDIVRIFKMRKQFARKVCDKFLELLFCTVLYIITHPSIKSTLWAMSYWQCSSCFYSH